MRGLLVFAATDACGWFSAASWGLELSVAWVGEDSTERKSDYLLGNVDANKVECGYLCRIREYIMR